MRKAFIQLHTAIFLAGFTGILVRHIDLNEGSRLVSLKDWIARKPSGAKVIFVTNKSSHLEEMQASAIGGTGVFHRPFDGRKLLAKLIGEIAATPIVRRLLAGTSSRYA